MRIFDENSDYKISPLTSGSFRFPETIFIIEQNSRKFFVKSFFREAQKGWGADCMERELQSIQAFQQLGVKVLSPVDVPREKLDLSDGNRLFRLRNVLIYPLMKQLTQAEIIGCSLDPEPLVREAARRIRVRHQRVTSLLGIHSDGAPHNIFEDWTWFDFGEPHVSQNLQTAKDAEVWQFCAGLTAVCSPNLVRRLVAAFCDEYQDMSTVRRLIVKYERAVPWLRMSLQPVNLIRLKRGNPDQFYCLRTAMAMRVYFKNRR